MLIINTIQPVPLMRNITAAVADTTTLIKNNSSERFWNSTNFVTSSWKDEHVSPLVTVRNNNIIALLYIYLLIYCMHVDSKAYQCAKVLSDAGSRNPVLVLNGGYERFSADYPFLRTQKIMWLPQV